MGENATTRSGSVYSESGDIPGSVGLILARELRGSAGPEHGEEEGLRVDPPEPAASTKPPTLLIVDDRGMLTEALEFSVGRLGIKVIGVEINLDRAAFLVGRHQPDAVLLGESGDRADVATRLLRFHPGMKVIFMVLDVAIQSQQGVYDVLSPAVSLADFAAGIHKVTMLGPAVAMQLLPNKRSTEAGIGSQGVSRLTKREIQVVSLLTQGINAQMIGRQLSISTNTVRTHIQHILVKLQAHSQVEAAAVAREHGLVPALR